MISPEPRSCPVRAALRITPQGQAPDPHHSSRAQLRNMSVIRGNRMLPLRKQRSGDPAVRFMYTTALRCASRYPSALN